MEPRGNVCFPAAPPQPKCPLPQVLPLAFAHLRTCRVPSFQLAVGCKQGAFSVVSLGKRQASSWKVFCPSKHTKKLTNSPRNKETEVNYSHYQNQESHSGQGLGPMALPFGRSEEDFYHGGKSGDRPSRLPSITRESVVDFRTELEVHISCITFLVCFFLTL